MERVEEVLKEKEEEETSVLRKQVERLQEENEAYRRKYELLLSSTVTRVSHVPEGEARTQKTTDEIGSKKDTSGTRFQLVTLTDDLPLLIDPRDTVARRCCSKRVAAFLWYLHRSRFVLFVLLVLTVLSQISLGLSIVADYAMFGYFYSFCFPYVILSAVHMSVPRLRVVITSFNFISLFVLIVIAWTGIADAVMMPNEGYGRPFAAFAHIVITPIALVARECRIPSKKKTWVLFYAILLSASVHWTMIILWYTGNWINVSRPSFRLDPCPLISKVYR